MTITYIRDYDVNPVLEIKPLMDLLEKKGVPI